MRPNWRNRTLCHGDNLVFMRSMDSGTVHLIATDPPFNKGRDFHATPESLARGASFQDRWRWDEDVHPEWVEQIQDDWPGVWAVIDWTRMVHSDAMGAFLAFMAVRLMAMHRILREDGSIYLHCDPTASHYLKTLMDAVFGARQFRNEIVWKRTSAGRSDAQRYGRVHDVILYYTKSAAKTWNTQYLPHDEEYVRKKYKFEDERGRFGEFPLIAEGRITKGESGKPWRGIDPNEKGNHWRTPTKGGMNDYIRQHGLIPGWPDAYPGVHERLDALDKAGLIYWPPRGKIPRLKRYLDSTAGIAIGSVITDVGHLQEKASENLGYPTQKPLALYRRIIRASSNEGDVVFDPFAGCATTPVAAELEGRQWLACDLWDGAHQVVLDRLARDIEAEQGQKGQMDFWRKEVHLRREPFVRSDDGETAAPALRSLARRATPPSMKREAMVKALVAQNGVQCQGCGRTFDSTRYLELDHIVPRSDGGSNELSNRVLLCGPCNRTKSNRLTLSGLREQNRKDGFMKP